MVIAARYGFKEPRSRVIERPDDPLYHAFGEWLKEVPGEIEYDNQEPHYQRALEALKGIDGIKPKTPADLNPILLAHQDYDNIRNAGLFLSAFYNSIDQTDLVWDLDIDERINWIGYKLDRGKRLVLKADSGNEIGTESSGLLVNYADVEGDMAWKAEGSAVNFGNVAEFAWDAKGSAVNFGSVSGSMCLNAKGSAVNFGSVGFSMSSNGLGSSVNFGSVGTYIAREAENIQANIAIRNPDGNFQRYGDPCLDENEAKQHPRLITYFEEFKRQGEAYRNADFPECFGVFDVVERFVGSGSGDELNKQFMEKLRGLLD